MRGLIFLALMPLAAAVLAVEPASLKHTQTIALPGVKGRLDHMALDAIGHRLFVAALGNNTLEVIDLLARERVRSVPGMSKPTGVLFFPGSNRIFVANGNDGTLKIVDGSTFQVVHQIAAFDNADNLRFDPRTGRVCLGYGDGVLGFVDPDALKEVARVRLPNHPESFQLEGNGRRMFVNVPGASQIVVIDRDQREVVQAWPMEQYRANFPMALDDGNSRLFIGCRKPARLVVLDTHSGKPVADLAISGDVDDLFYDDTLKRLYLSCGQGFIDVVDQQSANSYQLRERIATRAGARTAFYSRDFKEFYLALPQRATQPAEVRIFKTLK